MNAPVAVPVTTVEELTPEWVTAALGREVRSVTATTVGTGQMGACYRLELGGVPEVPATLLAKLPTADPATREFLHGSYRNEVTFYRTLAPTVAVTAPACHYAAISEDPALRGTFTLLLEDLAPADQGDQIAGCTPEQALAAAVNVAGLHAPRWCDPSLLEVEGLAHATAADAELLDAIYPEAVEKVVAQLASHLPREDVATLRGTAPLAGAWSTGRSERFGLVHGDYRLDNLLFHPDGRLWAVDWQTLALGLPVRDVAFLVSSGLTVADRRTHEERVVEGYRQRLVELGVGDYPRELCWEDYRYGLLQTLLIAVLGCAYASSRTDRGDLMFATMITRGCQAVRDHRTAELVTAP